MQAEEVGIMTLDVHIGLSAGFQDNTWPDAIVENQKAKRAIKLVKELSCFPQVHEWILRRLAVSEIAVKIKELGEWGHYTLSTCCVYLHAYRESIPKALIVDRNFRIGVPEEILSTPAKFVMKNAVAAVRKYTDHLDKFNQLIEWQHKRIEMAIRLEQEGNALMAGTHKEFKVAQELMIAALDIKDRIIGPEVQDQQVKDISNQLDGQNKIFDKYDLDSVYAKAGLTDVLKNPSSRMKIMNTVDRLLTTYAKDVKSVNDIPEDILVKPKVDVEVPEIPGDESWKNDKPEIIYVASQEPVKIENPFVDPNFNPDEYIPAVRRREPG